MHVLDALVYLSRKGPMPDAAPLSRAVLAKAHGEPRCSASAVNQALRVLYVTEGDAIIPEVAHLVEDLPAGHELRIWVENFIERRPEGRPPTE